MLPRAAVYFWFRIHFTLCRRPSQNPRYDTAAINKHAAASAAKTRLLQLVKLNPQLQQGQKIKLRPDSRCIAEIGAQHQFLNHQQHQYQQRHTVHAGD